MPGERSYAHRARIDKLGVQPGMRVVLLGNRDESLVGEISKRTDDVTVGRRRKEADIVFFGAENLGALDKLGPVVELIQQDGAIWVVYPKGQRHITQGDVMAAAKAAGLVDVKVVGFSTTHTALKMVIPRTQRQRTSR